MKICHYRCFASDSRVSMEVYGDSLAQSMQGGSFKIETFQPRSRLEKFASNRMVMRYLRYVYYPRLVAGQGADIHHVTDHGYAHLLPRLAPGKKCISVHDLIPILNWKGVLGSSPHCDESVLKTPKPALNLFSLSFLRGYDQIITISENTANDLVEYLALDREKIAVVPPIISSNFVPADDREVEKFARRYQLDTNYRWIMISGREFNKNHRTSLLVLKQLNQQQNKRIKLVKTGLPSTEFDSLVSAMGLEDLVEQTYLKDVRELTQMYGLKYAIRGQSGSNNIVQKQ